MGEHGRRLAETHVECQTAAETRRVEEPDPGDRLGLIRAQRTRETLRLGDRRHRHFAGAADDVVRPTAALHNDAASQPGPAETDAVPQDLGAGELRDVLAFGEGGRGLLDIEPVDLHPAATRLHQWPGLAGEALDVVGRQFDVVEQHRPCHVAELVRADDGVRGGLGEQSQRGSRLASRQRRQPHVEPNGRERGPDDGHEMPRLVLAHRDLTAARAADPVDRREQPAEPLPFRNQRSSSAFGTHRRVDRDQAALAGRCRHRREPHAARCRGVQLDDQLRPRRFRHGLRPLFDPPRQRSRQCNVGRERRSVHSRQHGVLEVDRRLRRRGLSRQLRTLDALGHDRFDRQR